jgi:hypothetical protein
LLTARRVLASALVGIYMGLLCGLMGGLATFWMWGFGALLTLPAGFAAGVVLGWKISLRDAVILFSSCFGSLLALRNLDIISVLPPVAYMWAGFVAVPVSGLLSWLACSKLSV